MRRLLVLLVVVVASSSTAQGFVSVGSSAFSQAVKGMSTAQFHALANEGAATLTRSVSWGTRVGFTGSVAIVGGAIGSAVLITKSLEWLHTALDNAYSTGTGLDTWEDPGASGPSSEQQPYVAAGDTAYWWGDATETAPFFKVVGASSGSAYYYYADDCGHVRDTGSTASWSHLWDVAWPAFVTWYDACYSSGGSGPSLYDFLDANPDALDAYKNQVLPDYLDDRLANGPHTFEDPLGDGSVIVSPVPNVNQWWDDPYADPSLDSDGDGYTDWEEDVAGTDPNDPASTPTVSPDPNRDTDGDGYPDWYERDQGTDPNDAASTPATAAPEPETDSDGDGVVDAYDPCPFSAANTCAANAESETLAQESTLQEVRDALDAEAATPQSVPALAAWLAPTLSADAWASVHTHVETSTGTFVAAVEPKIPFLAGPWLPLVSFGSAGTCDAIPLSILGTTHDVGMCSTPVHSFLAGTGRLVLLALMAFAWHMSVAVMLTET